MELIERLPINRINFLNDLDLRGFKQFSKCKNDADHKIKFNMMKAFCATNIKTRGETKRIYSYTMTTPLEVGGRLYCGNSIQGLQKDMRGFLLNGISTDLDMCNAHPVILHYICTLHNIPAPNLSYYIKHRSSVLEDFDADGKMHFLAAVNDDKLNKKISNKFFKDFDKECKTLQKLITALPEYKHIVESVPATRMYNWLGSAINRILCVFENKIIQEVLSICNRKQIEVCSLMFDGIMIYGDYYQDTELLDNITKTINEVFAGMDMAFAYKPHSPAIVMPDDYVPIVAVVVDVDVEKTFEVTSKLFEETHAKIINKGFFIKEDPDKITIMSKSHLITTYEHKVYEFIAIKPNGSRAVALGNFIQSWTRNNPTQRCFDDIECYPDAALCPNNIYNSWRPFAMESITEYVEMPDALTKMRNHISILCGNDPVVTTYIEAWIAQMIQFPAVKSICPTLISKQGAGKGTFMMLLQKMIGESKYFETPTPSRDVWGSFNGRMTSTFLVNLDELSRKESVECDGAIKALITNPKMTINNKGINQFSIMSYHRFISTTNNEDPVKTSKDDRRNLIVRSSDELIGNTEYFNEMYKLLNDVNVVKTCFEFFKNIPDMQNFNKLKLPITSYQEDITDASRSPIESWIIDYATENSECDSPIELIGQVQYTLFIEWCKRCGFEYKISSIQFAVRLKRLSIPCITQGRHTKSGNTLMFDIPAILKHFNISTITEIL